MFSIVNLTIFYSYAGVDEILALYNNNTNNIYFYENGDNAPLYERDI